MKYLEITILSLFIGFLIIFFLSNSVYNKCISEKTKESFIDAQERATRAAQARVNSAQRARANAEAMNRAAGQQKTLMANMAKTRGIQRASNKLVTAKWDNTRNSQFGKFNSYANNISSNSRRLGGQGYWRAMQWKKNNMIPYTNSTFSNSTPVQLNKLTKKIGDFYTESKTQDGKLEKVAKRITSVNNLLAG